MSSWVHSSIEVIKYKMHKIWQWIISCVSNRPTNNTYERTHSADWAPLEVISIDSQARTLGMEGAGLLSNEPVDVQTMFMSLKWLVVPDWGCAECNSVTGVFQTAAHRQAAVLNETDTDKSTYFTPISFTALWFLLSTQSLDASRMWRNKRNLLRGGMTLQPDSHFIKTRMNEVLK